MSQDDDNDEDFLLVNGRKGSCFWRGGFKQISDLLPLILETAAQTKGKILCVLECTAEFSSPRCQNTEDCATRKMWLQSEDSVWPGKIWSYGLKLIMISISLAINLAESEMLCFRFLEQGTEAILCYNLMFFLLKDFLIFLIGGC